MGHMMKDCQAPFNIRNMMYEELWDHFEQAEAAKKDRDAIFFFFKSTTYIPPYPSTCAVAK